MKCAVEQDLLRFQNAEEKAMQEYESAIADFESDCANILAHYRSTLEAVKECDIAESVASLLALGSDAKDRVKALSSIARAIVRTHEAAGNFLPQDLDVIADKLAGRIAHKLGLAVRQ